MRQNGVSSDMMRLYRKPMTSLQMPDRNLKTERRKLMRSLRMPDRNWRTAKRS